MMCFTTVSAFEGTEHGVCFALNHSLQHIMTGLVLEVFFCLYREEALF